MRTLAILTAVVLAACGGIDAVSLADYTTAERDAVCSHYAKCGLIEDLETCRKVGLDVVLDQRTSERAAAGMAKSGYDGDSVARCFEAAAGRSCDVTSQSSREIPDACFEQFPGTQQDGEPCGIATECVSQVCTKPSCPMACCIGTCTGDAAPGHAKVGESCEHARCDTGSFCDRVAMMCVALKPRGQSCLAPEECQYGLDCGRDSVCALLPGPDQPCTDVCRDEGTVCKGTCVKVGLSGAACATSEDCSRMYHCDATRHCSTGAALGAACIAGQPCAGDGAFCKIPDGELQGTCAAPQPDGSPCQKKSNCESQYCDPDTLLCAAEPVCI
jgi:hypothetical protein